MTHPQSTWDADYGHAAGRHESRAAIQSHDAWYWNLGDDIDAFMYYGSLGLYDPTIPGEVSAWKAKGHSFGAAVGITFARAVLLFTGVMWLVDPADKREGGLAETEWYQDVSGETGEFWDWLWSGKDIDIYT